MRILKNKDEFFLRGRTSQFISQFDNRFSYCAYIPEDFNEKTKYMYTLAVIVHGSLRNAQEYRDAFIEFAERNKVIIFSPLFPSGITNPWENDSYKFVRIGNEAFDIVLIKMIEEFSEKIGISMQKFLLHGYSGGGQFVHRFFYLHPEKVMGLSIGAPGNVTLLDNTKPWYIGVADYEKKFNKRLEINKMRNVPVLMVVGNEDQETWMINDRDAPYWDQRFLESGENRVERLKTLRRSFEEVGIIVDYVELDGVGHEGFKVLGEVNHFFCSVLKYHKDKNAEG